MGELRSASALLNDLERATIRLVILEKYTQREAASALGLSQPMVSRHLCAGLARLRAAPNLVLDSENF